MKYTKENLKEYCDSRSVYNKCNKKLITRVHEVVKIIKDIYDLNIFSIWFYDAAEEEIGNSDINCKSAFVKYETSGLDFNQDLYFNVPDYNHEFPIDFLFADNNELKEFLIKEKTENRIKLEKKKINKYKELDDFLDLALMAKTLKENGYEVTYKPKK
jgi:hypothetical protein